MFSSWHFILFIIVFDSVRVFGNSTETHSKNPDVKHARVTRRKAKKSNDEKADLKRPLQTGDTFVPMELLPITKRLFAKGILTTCTSHTSLAYKRNSSSTNSALRQYGSSRISASVKPGEGGRGIVSGSKTPAQMAERIYRAYFLTQRRIVLLTEKDLKGLDLLTALAMDGEVVKTRSSGDSITEKPTHLLNLNGQFVGVDPGPLRCHYKLLYKTVKPPDAILRKRHNERTTPFNKILKMEKKMRPNRSLIVNHKGRKSNKDNNNSSSEVHADIKAVKEQKNNKDAEQKTRNISTRQEVGKEGKKKVKKPKSKQNRKHVNKTTHRQNKRSRNLTRKQRKSRKKISKSNSTGNLEVLKNQHTEVPLTTTPRPSCRWRFFCQDPGDVDSCRLHTSCFDGSNNEPMLDKGVIDTIDKDIKEKEKTELVMHFRKMLKITSLDEDVEKIIEQHVLLVKPENLEPNEKIETLDQYFNNIIMAEYASYTTPSPNSNKDSAKSHPLFLEANSPERESQEQNAPLMGFESKEVLLNSGDETVKEPSASTDSDGNQAFKSPAQTHKFGALDVVTASMDSSTSKYNKKHKM